MCKQINRQESRYTAAAAESEAQGENKPETFYYNSQDTKHGKIYLFTLFNGGYY